MKQKTLDEILEEFMERIEECIFSQRGTHKICLCDKEKAKKEIIEWCLSNLPNKATGILSEDYNYGFNKALIDYIRNIKEAK